MESISIVTSSNIEPVRSRLYREFSLLQDEGILFKIDERQTGEMIFFGCRLIPAGKTPAGDTDKILRYYVASAIADLIVNDFQLGLLPKILKSHYANFTEEEKQQIVARAGQLLTRNVETGEEDLLQLINRRNQILYKVVDYLNTSNKLIIEGFVRFWLKDYFQELCEAVDRAVDGFVVDREYQEFIRLLKHFVAIQEPKADEVHVIVRASGLFRLLDRDRRVVDNEYLEGFVFDLVQNQMDYDDLLVSALITIAPRKIVLHFRKKREVAQTIVNVFEERVEFCPGCQFCEVEQGTDSPLWRRR
ncbi:MAG: putative sporulation protein YtxC [Firmicutes bacterium]|nr:putative sporulation protein YtxC [Bacillota bacterium]